MANATVVQGQIMLYSGPFLICMGSTLQLMGSLSQYIVVDPVGLVEKRRKAG